MIALSCPHGDIRDCHPCLAAAHRSAIRLASADVRAARGTGDPTATNRLHNRTAESRGFRLLSQIGIAPMLPDRFRAPWEAWTPVYCHACGQCGTPGEVCRMPECPGRRVRFQPPEVQ